MFSCRPWIDVSARPHPRDLLSPLGDPLLKPESGCPGLDDGIWKFLGDKEE